MIRSTKMRFGVSAAVLAVSLTACGTAGPSQNAGSGTAGWALTQGSQSTFQFAQSAWNSAHPGEQVNFQYFANDAYKDKIRVAIGANSAPALFENWGGGALGDYITAGKVAALSGPVVAAVRQKYFPSVLNVATFNGQLYGVPVNGTQPVVLYYNRDLFAQVGAQPPKTWDDLLALVAKFKAAGIAPITLGGGSKWPDLMYLEYLVDRIGGPSVVDDIVAGKPNAWNNPAIIQAATMIQQLVAAGAFAKGYESTTYDSGQASALLYTGKAAMQLMGSWDFATIKSSAPDFISGGKLGWTTFPTVPGGAGNPADIVGNPANFFSVTSAASASAQQTAADFLTQEVGSSAYVQDLLRNGNVPPVTGLESTLSAAPDPDWLLFQYNLVKNAPNYQLSWDQALSPAAGDTLLSTLDQLFLGKITPQQFATTMNQAGK